jgi:RimJ/RimL family protein N-acetyltransferase
MQAALPDWARRLVLAFNEIVCYHNPTYFSQGGIWMLFPELEFPLKDGRTAVFRSPVEADVPQMVDYLVKSAGETDFLMNYPEERSSLTYEREKAFLERVVASESDTMIVCLVDGKLVGTCQITLEQQIKTRHRATVAIGLLQEVWGQGIGTRMFQELLKIAENSPYVTQVELEFIEGNSRARGLYEKMGFRIAGVHPNAIRLKDGTMLNEYLMIKEL